MTLNGDFGAKKCYYHTVFFTTKCIMPRMEIFEIVLAIDMAGEKTFMKGGKTADGITNFTF